jgi:site-specific DNA-methyltransferase (adenine-specific)
MIEINKIYNENCLDTMGKMPNESIDLVVTSPPYDKIRDYNNYELDLHAVGEQTFRVLKGGGMLCMVISDGTKNFGKSITTAKTIVDYVENIGYKLFETVIYARDGRPGAWWNKRFRVDHEYILLFLKGDRPKYFDKEPLKIAAKHAGETWHGTQRLTNGNLIPIKKTKQNETKCRGTIWKYDASKSERNKKKLVHPATFPDKLAKDLILCFSDVDDLVYDPFLGSGTTARMAKSLERNYIGSDISNEYCRIAEEMLNG